VVPWKFLDGTCHLHQVSLVTQEKKQTMLLLIMLTPIPT